MLHLVPEKADALHASIRNSYGLDVQDDRRQEATQIKAQIVTERGRINLNTPSEERLQRKVAMRFATTRRKRPVRKK